MKNALFILTFLFVSILGSSICVSAQSPTTTISFNELQYDFGNVKQGKNVSHSFAFQNTGTEPLIIKSAKGSCGCTVPKYSKKPIAPGQWSEILVTFKSANKDGVQIKTVTINANTTPNPIRLTITANVLVGKQPINDQSLLPNSTLQDATLPQTTENPNTDPELKDAILLPELIETTPATDAATMSYDDLPKTTIKFEEMEHDFGKIKQGDNVSHIFVFKNTGTKPLIISSAKSSCGCTVPDYPKDPIAPGQKGEISVMFNSTGKAGTQTKTITINANTDPNPTRLTIKTEVILTDEEWDKLTSNPLQDATLPQTTENLNTDPELIDAILLPELIEPTPDTDATLLQTIENLNTDPELKDAILLPDLIKTAFDTDVAAMYNLPKATIEFEEMEYDFGTIKQGDKVNHIFVFKNTGTEPLIISSAKGSCGCTVPNYPKDFIAPGQKGEISVEFSSAGKSGAQTKTVTIIANTDPNPTRITIKAYIDVPQKDIAEDLLTELQFEDTNFAFGTVAPNEQLIHTFKFKNVGEMPFILDGANCGCGCKVLKQPKHPIAPGKSGSIKISLDSTEKLGDLDKKLFISGNVPNNFYELGLSAHVAATLNTPETSTPEHTHTPICVPPPPSKFRSNDANANEMAIRVYPTVSSNGIVNIALPTDSSPAKISVFDMSGKMVLQNVLPTSSSIELPNTAGNYIVQIETNALKVMRKVERY